MINNSRQWDLPLIQLLTSKLAFEWLKHMLHFKWLRHIYRGEGNVEKEGQWVITLDYAWLQSVTINDKATSGPKRLTTSSKSNPKSALSHTPGKTWMEKVDSGKVGADARHSSIQGGHRTRPKEANPMSPSTVRWHGVPKRNGGLQDANTRTPKERKTVIKKRRKVDAHVENGGNLEFSLDDIEGLSDHCTQSSWSTTGKNDVWGGSDRARGVAWASHQHINISIRVIKRCVNITHGQNPSPLFTQAQMNYKAGYNTQWRTKMIRIPTQGLACKLKKWPRIVH